MEQKIAAAVSDQVTAVLSRTKDLSEEDRSSQREALRRNLLGYVHQWEASFEAIEQDISIDRRHELARQVEFVLLETIRLAATTDHRLPVLGQLTVIARDAAALQQLRVYMDGGKSFAELTKGCRRIIAAAREAVDKPWVPSKAGSD